MLYSLVLILLTFMFYQVICVHYFNTSTSSRINCNEIQCRQFVTNKFESYRIRRSTLSEVYDSLLWCQVFLSRPEIKFRDQYSSHSGFRQKVSTLDCMLEVKFKSWRFLIQVANPRIMKSLNGSRIEWPMKYMEWITWKNIHMRLCCLTLLVKTRWGNFALFEFRLRNE